MAFTIWVDADACPREVKEVVFKAAKRCKVPVVMVANKAQALPKTRYVTMVVVAQGLDVADMWIVQHAEAGDLVITQDVPLAAELVPNGVTAMSPRGETWTESNIRERLSIRDFMTEARASGITTGGPAPFDNKVKRAFANAFDRWLTPALQALHASGGPDGDASQA